MIHRILVTLGPSSLNKEVVQECAKIGVYLYRINLSHTRLEDVAETIKKIRNWSDVPICLDSEGAQLRNQKMIEEQVRFIKGEMVSIHHKPVIGDSNNISFAPEGMSYQFIEGDVINVDFNNVSLRIIKVADTGCRALVVQGGIVGSNKAADLNRSLEFATLTKKDIDAIEIGRKLAIKHFALSFTNRKKDVETMRLACGQNAKIICKIESQAGVKNLDEIIESADEILVDRGDLSRTVPIEKVPFLQRKIISIARAKKTPVFVATNLLESMVSQRSPNRAEVNDVVSTLLMGANGLVLAAETAIGRYPIDCVSMIKKLINESKDWTEDISIRDILNK